MLSGSINAAEVSSFPEDLETAPTQREILSCELEYERLTSWSKLAGSKKPEELKKAIPNSAVVEVLAGDGRTIRGIRIGGAKANKYALLIIQGNAWSTRDFSNSIAPYAPTDLVDVYFFDFRGYGLSKPGNPTMAAIIADYQDIARWLAQENYSGIYLYAFSFGGVTAMNAFPDQKPFTRVVIDAVPSRPSKLGFVCEHSFDPIDHLPKSCPSLTFMHGTSDWVISRELTQDLINGVQACGGELDINESRGHPFQAEWSRSRKRRFKAIIDHLKLPGE